MSKLMDELRDDPNAVFEISADLPSGNTLIGLIGPMVGIRLTAEFSFTGPATEEDMEWARKTAEQIIGIKPDFIMDSRNKAEHDNALAKAHQFMREGIN